MTAGSPPLPDADYAAARAALQSVVPRLVELIRGIGDPAAHAVGEWSAGDVAVHLTTVWERLPGLALGRMESPIKDVWELGDLTAGLVRDATQTDHAAVAACIQGAAQEFFDATADATGDETGPWLVEGTTAALRTFTCHLLNECLVHGDDIARAEGRQWTIAPEHAAMVLTGFVTPVIAKMDPSTLVIADRAAGVDVCYRISLRGLGCLYLTIAAGGLTVEPQPTRRIDCRISADPAALLLLLFNRRGLWATALRGRLLAWGRRPWMAPRLRTMVRNP